MYFPRFLVAQIGLQRQRQHEPATEIVQMAHGLVVVGGVIIFGRVDAERIGMDHARRRRFIMAHGIVEPHPDHLGIGDEFGHRCLRHCIAVLALHLVHELGEADKQFRHAGRLDHAAGALP